MICSGCLFSFYAFHETKNKIWLFGSLSFVSLYAMNYKIYKKNQ
jgi:hypothetical protein